MIILSIVIIVIVIVTMCSRVVFGIQLVFFGEANLRGGFEGKPFWEPHM